MATTGQPPRGLSAAELAGACAELRPLVGARVADAFAVPRGTADSDLVLVFAAAGGKAFLHAATGGPTARLCLTARRWPKPAMQPSPFAGLIGAMLTGIGSLADERIARLHFASDAGERQLVVELFGTRGLIALLDADGRVLRTSRAVATATRQLAPGDVYAPPPRGERPAVAGIVRFAPPVLAAIDDWGTRHDLLAEARRRGERLLLDAQRTASRLQAKVDGLTQRLADAGRAAALRATADLMLAYQHAVARGAASMTVPDPGRDGAEIEIPLDPARPVVAQAQTLYEQARRLDDGRAVQEARLQQAQRDLAAAAQNLAAAAAIARQLAALDADRPDLAAALAALPFPPERARAATGARAGKAARRPDDGARGENVRRFVSAEGYPIWVGRTNEQNDRLTLRLANGNDLWLHVGGGRAGAHVVVRLPKGKTASLETLLDAATLAVHFSKARGEGRIDVVYTQRKHVRKPKGLPAGAVVPSQTKTITVHRDDARLQRLLASGSQPDAD